MDLVTLFFFSAIIIMLLFHNYRLAKQIDTVMAKAYASDVETAIKLVLNIRKQDEFFDRINQYNDDEVAYDTYNFLCTSNPEISKYVKLEKEDDNENVQRCSS